MLSAAKLIAARVASPFSIKKSRRRLFHQNSRPRDVDEDRAAACHSFHQNSRQVDVDEDRAAAYQMVAAYAQAELQHLQDVGAAYAQVEIQDLQDADAAYAQGEIQDLQDVDAVRVATTLQQARSSLVQNVGCINQRAIHQNVPQWLPRVVYVNVPRCLHPLHPYLIAQKSSCLLPT